MTDNNLSREVLNKIEKDDLKPKPRWEFFIKNFMILVLGACSLIIGALIVAVIIYMTKTNDIEFLRQTNQGVYGFIIRTLPYFWLSIFALFVIAAYYNIRHSKSGYRYRLPTIVVIILVLSIFSGFLLHNVGVGQAIDDVISESVPIKVYTKVLNPRLEFWSRPDSGFIAGLIVEIEKAEGTLMIIDKNRDEWIIIINEAKNPKEIEFMAGMPIKAVGEILPENYFKAVGIWPMGPGQGFFKKMRERQKRFPGFKEMEEGTFLPPHLHKNNFQKGI